MKKEMVSINWFFSPIQVNFLQEDSSMSLSSLSALDGVKQQVHLSNITPRALHTNLVGNALPNS